MARRRDAEMKPCLVLVTLLCSSILAFSREDYVSVQDQRLKFSDTDFVDLPKKFPVLDWLFGRSEADQDDEPKKVTLRPRFSKLDFNKQYEVSLPCGFLLRVQATAVGPDSAEKGNTELVSSGRREGEDYFLKIKNALELPDTCHFIKETKLLEVILSYGTVTIKGLDKDELEGSLLLKSVRAEGAGLRQGTTGWRFGRKRYILVPKDGKASVNEKEYVFYMENTGYYVQPRPTHRNALLDYIKYPLMIGVLFVVVIQAYHLTKPVLKGPVVRGRATVSTKPVMQHTLTVPARPVTQGHQASVSKKPVTQGRTRVSKKPVVLNRS